MVSDAHRDHARAPAISGRIAEVTNQAHICVQLVHGMGMLTRSVVGLRATLTAVLHD
jgi:hypothetical protein